MGHTSAVHSLWAQLRITKFPTGLQRSIIAEVVLPGPTSHTSPCPAFWVWLLESCLCFLCAARPRDHITAHMLMKQLLRCCSTPSAPASSQPPQQWSETNYCFNLSNATLQFPVTRMCRYVCYQHF